MIWGHFSYYGVLWWPIYRILGIMDQFAYIKILEEVLLLYVEDEMLLKWVFKQDSDPKHTIKQALSWFQAKQLKLLSDQPNPWTLI